MSARTRISVLFPAPFDPIRPRRSPLPSVKLIWSSARTTLIRVPLSMMFPPMARAFATTMVRSDCERVVITGISMERFSTTILGIVSNPICDAATKTHIHQRSRRQGCRGQGSGDDPGLDFHRPSQDRIAYDHQHIRQGVQFEELRTKLDLLRIPNDRRQKKQKLNKYLNQRWDVAIAQ